MVNDLMNELSQKVSRFFVLCVVMNFQGIQHLGSNHSKIASLLPADEDSFKFCSGVVLVDFYVIIMAKFKNSNHTN
jgi:hypothetical protein